MNERQEQVKATIEESEDAIRFVESLPNPEVYRRMVEQLRSAIALLRERENIPANV